MKNEQLDIFETRPTLKDRHPSSFACLSIHEKINWRGNQTIAWRTPVVSWYNYHYYPICTRDARHRFGNLPYLMHIWLQRKYKWRSGETLRWLYGWPERKVIEGSSRKWDKKDSRWVETAGTVRVEPATAGAYGYGGTPWWKLPVMPIKHRRLKKQNKT